MDNNTISGTQGATFHSTDKSVIMISNKSRLIFKKNFKIVQKLRNIIYPFFNYKK